MLRQHGVEPETDRTPGFTAPRNVHPLCYVVACWCCEQSCQTLTSTYPVVTTPHDVTHTNAWFLDIATSSSTTRTSSILSATSSSVPATFEKPSAFPMPTTTTGASVYSAYYGDGTIAGWPAMKQSISFNQISPVETCLQ